MDAEFAVDAGQVRFDGLRLMGSLAATSRLGMAEAASSATERSDGVSRKCWVRPFLVRASSSRASLAHNGVPMCSNACNASTKVTVAAS